MRAVLNVGGKGAMRAVSLAVLLIAAMPAAFADRLFSDAELVAEYAGAPSRFLEVDGVVLHYRDEGSGPVLVLLNGHLGSLHMWEPWVERLRSHFRLVRLDYPPYGLSGPDPSGIYTTQRAMQLLAGFIDALALGRVHVGGTSNGALVALFYAIEHPESVDRLVVSTLPAGRPPPRQPSDALRAGAALARDLAPVQPRAFFEALLNDITADSAIADEAAIDRYWKLNNRKGARGWVDDYIQSQYELWDTLDVVDYYARLTRPVLLQWGADGVVLPEAVGHDVAGLLINAAVRLEQYRGAGHLPMLERPDETAADVLDFLSNWRPELR